jgi:hypothetical protein
MSESELLQVNERLRGVVCEVRAENKELWSVIEQDWWDATPLWAKAAMAVGATWTAAHVVAWLMVSITWLTLWIGDVKVIR